MPLIQAQHIDTIYAENVSIEKIGYNSSLDSVKSRLGKPKDYSTYEEEEGEAEGYDKWFYFTYDSLKLALYEWNGDVHLSSFSNRNKRYKVELGRSLISVGDSIDILRTSFPHSFREFVSRQAQHHDYQQEEFYIRIAVVYPNAVSYDGIVNIKVRSQIITEISASFQPA